MAIKKQTFINGVIVIAISQIIIKLMGFLYRIITTNFKEFADVGNSYYGTGFKVYLIIIAIATVGLPGAISKLVSEKLALEDKKGAHKIFKTALKLFTLTGLLFSSLMYFGSDYIATVILSNPGVSLILKVLAPSILFVSIAAVFRGYFVGMSNMSIHSRAQIYEQIVNSVLSVLFVYLLLWTNNPIYMAAGSTAATTVSTVIALIYMVVYYLKNRVDIWEQINKSESKSDENESYITKKLLSVSIPLSLGTIVTTIASMIDLITITSGLQKSGLNIEQANKLMGILLGKVEILIGLPMAINVAFAVSLIPAVTRALTIGDNKDAEKKINTSLKFSTILSMPCAIGIIILAKPILNLIFPNASDGYEILQLSAGIIVFSMIAQTTYGALQGAGKLYIPVICIVFAGIVKYILNTIFIQRYGINIAPISTMIYQTIAVFISVTALYSTLKMKFNFIGIILKPLFSSVIMGFVTYYSYVISYGIFNRQSFAFITSVILSIISYLLMLILTKTLDEKEIKMIPFIGTINTENN